MPYESLLNWIALGVLLLFGTLSVLLLRKIHKSERPPMEKPDIVTGEHLRVKKKIKELGIEVPPKTRIVRPEDRKPEK